MNNSVFVFWQNIISPHQIELLKAISKFCKVVLIVEQEMYEFRSKMGWKVERFNCVEIIVSDRVSVWKELENKYRGDECFHIISGLATFEISKFALSCKFKNSYLMAEAPDQNRWFLIVRYIRDVVKNIIFARHVKGFLCIGHHSLKWFKSARFGIGCFHPFAYSVRDDGFYEDDIQIRNSIEICYVGSLIKLKRVDTIIEAYFKCDFNGMDSCLNIIGSGEEQEGLKSLADKLKVEGDCKEIKFWGMMSNDAVYERLRKSDILVLASRHDGWGAVVNEALQKGCQVVVSSRCGSISAINDFNGYVYQYGSDNELEVSIFKCISRISQDNRIRIRKMYEKSLAAPVLAQYLVKVVIEECDANAPWIVL